MRKRGTTIQRKKIALITGITGQDGAYLSRLLLKKGYQVHGIIRRSSSFNTSRIDNIRENLHLHYGDMCDSISLQNILAKVKPNEIYNLAAQSHVKVSFELPEYTAQVDAVGTLRLLEAVRILGLKSKIYQASTSELYGGDINSCPEKGFNEKSPFNPRSPYAIAKMYSFYIAKNYREAYGMFISNGILFNHESPLRGETFVSKKIITAAVKIVSAEEQQPISLGNLNAIRDWGHAEDYVEAMWMMLQTDTPDDYVVATGQEYSVRAFTIMVFKRLGVEISFKGKELNEVGIVKKDTKFLKKGQVVVQVDAKYYRPTEVDYLLGNSTKIRKHLGWKPKHNIHSLIEDIIIRKIIDNTLEKYNG